jgi:UDP-GlcNAc:undecaprenyl-phosphate GlcNAc-1-phosphate transferase
MRELAAYLFLVALFIASFATPLAIYLGKRWGILDLPGHRKIHQDPIPIVGGWAIFLTLTLVVWGHLLGALAIRGSDLEVYLGDRLQHFVSWTPRLIMRAGPVYLGALGMFILGLIDDIKGMSVRSRLVAQVGIAVALVSMGFHPDLGYFPKIVGCVAGVVWIVGITNSFNFLDGLDGLASGVAMVGTLALLTIMGIADQPDVVFFLSALAGTLMGFLRFNYHPARVFLGSSGSLLVGYLMAMGTLQVTYQRGIADNWMMPLLTPVFVLAIPLYDTTSVVLIRLLQKRSIAIGDQSHFHHRLMKIGFSHRQTVAFIILIAFSVALSAVRLVQATLLQCIAILAQILSILSILVIAERVAFKVRAELLKRDARKKAAENEIQEVGTTGSL